MSDVRLETRVIVPTKIEVETRKGTEILVVEDGNRNHYTTAIDYIRNKTLKRKDRYLDREWRIAYKPHSEGYNDFYGFLFPVPSQESKEDLRAEIEKLRGELESLKSERSD